MAGKTSTMLLMDAAIGAASLLGWWVADDDKAVLIESTDCEATLGSLLVSVHPALGAEPYQSAELLDGRTNRIERLVATPRTEAGVRYLRVEAGTESYGPTYHLYPVTRTSDGWQPVDVTLRQATPAALLPNVKIGLYDDFDDDLGAPWAFPLLPLMRARS